MDINEVIKKMQEEREQLLQRSKDIKDPEIIRSINKVYGWIGNLIGDLYEANSSINGISKEIFSKAKKYDLICSMNIEQLASKAKKVEELEAENQALAEALTSWENSGPKL